MKGRGRAGQDRTGQDRTRQGEARRGKAGHAGQEEGEATPGTCVL
jgi:hypothetical protein